MKKIIFFIVRILLGLINFNPMNRIDSYERITNILQDDTLVRLSQAYKIVDFAEYVMSNLNKRYIITLDHSTSFELSISYIGNKLKYKISNAQTEKLSYLGDFLPLLEQELEFKKVDFENAFLKDVRNSEWQKKQ